MWVGQWLTWQSREQYATALHLAHRANFLPFGWALPQAMQFSGFCIIIDELRLEKFLSPPTPSIFS